MSKKTYPPGYFLAVVYANPPGWPPRFVPQLGSDNVWSEKRRAAALLGKEKRAANGNVDWVHKSFSVTPVKGENSGPPNRT